MTNLRNWINIVEGRKPPEDEKTDDEADDDEPFWTCVHCGWEGDPDKVGSRCPGCHREIADDED